ncbi:ABC transporter ATP-binding protein [Novosphingopyxis sp.]|uniref:ABC transporter ATP-binding protein n=1 Tax=Novosphingopyxis sp. TaxID=2709690 RepID=UPI003B5C383B
MTAELAIATDGLSKRFGATQALRDLSLAVPERCVYGFLGPNGAGKTTTMRLLLGLLRPSGGRVRLFGADVARDRVAALRGVGAVIETPALYEHLSGRDNLALTARLLKLGSSEIDRVLEIVDMAKAAGRKVRGYSLGMKQRLALGRALLGEPRLLLLDEPTNGLDPEGIVVMRALIRDLPERLGCTVFLSSHLLAEVDQIAAIVGVMKEGRLLLQGSKRDLLGDSNIVRIGLDDTEAGRAVLVNAGAAIVDQEPGQLSVRAIAARTPRESASRFNALLVGAGIAVHRLQLESRSLEQLYHDTAAGEGDR